MFPVRETGAFLMLFLVLVMTSSKVTAQVGFTFPGDAAVCTPAYISTPMPSQALGNIWAMEIEWRDLLKNRSYILTDYVDMPNKRETVVVSHPFAADAKLHIDYNTRDVTVEDGTDPVTCQVVRGRVGSTYSYRDLFWLTSFNLLFEQFIGSQDAYVVGQTNVRGIPATNWSACLYDYSKNMTTKGNLYFSGQLWMAPFQPPGSMMPLRLEYFARQHNGSQVTEYRVVGDIFQFSKGQPLSPDIFVTGAGVFCPNRTGGSMRFPGIPDRFSLLMEVLDLDFKKINYEELWYDRVAKMVRWDFKMTHGTDDDPFSYIFDFNVDVKYMIDRHLMRCQTPTGLGPGDDFVAYVNNTVSLKTGAAYFYADSPDNIQYVGQTTVRGVLCDTWVGQYYDIDLSRYVTVQWYFTERSWMEATGSVEGSWAFYRMDVWRGGSRNPTIYNILRYNPTAPDFNAFDFAVCYQANQKKHFTVEFKVLNPNKYSLLSGAYITQTVVAQLASRLQIQQNRFTDVTFDFDGESTLYMSATLLDRSPRGTGNVHEVDLQGAFDFLKGSIIVSHFQIMLMDSDHEPVPLEGVNVVEHNYHEEFSTTTATTRQSTTFRIPTLAPKPGSIPPTLPPPDTPTIPPMCPTPQPCNCTAGSRPTQLCPSSMPCTAQPVTCQPGHIPCPAAPTQLACPTTTPCSSLNRIDVQEQTTTSDISVGALVGGIMGALALGLVLGFVVTRIYYALYINRNPMTITLIDNVNSGL